MLSIAAYKRSFSGLLDVISENRKLNLEAASFGADGKNYEKLSQEVASLDNLIGKEGISKEEIQQNIVNFVSTRHGSLSINDLQPIHFFQDANYKIVTNQLDLEGNINQLLDAAYDFEKEFKFSRIVSINFYTLKVAKVETLHLKIIFQNYENNK